jgi:hypothetical protein
MLSKKTKTPDIEITSFRLIKLKLLEFYIMTMTNWTDTHIIKASRYVYKYNSSL